MNEVQLSNDLNILTNEIIQYGNTVQISYWEVGRRLRFIKENDLTHGDFMNYLKEVVHIDYSDANRLMSISEIPKLATWQNLPKRNLFLISTLPEEERTQEHVTSKGEVKTPDEMTVRELQELKKQLKAKDTQILQQARMIEDLGEQEPQVIEKEVVIEKVPDDYEFYKSQNETLRNEIKGLEIAIRSAPSKEEVERLKTQLSAKRKIENDELEQAQLKRLQRDADINVHKLILDMNNFIKEQAVTVYDSQAIAGATPETKAKLNDAIDRVENLLKDIKQEIGGEVTWIIN